MRQRAISGLLLSALALSACGATSKESPTQLDSLPLATVAPERSDGFVRVQSLEEINGIWVPIEIDSESIDAASLGAYLQIDSADGDRPLSGDDGCNSMSGWITPGKSPIDNGRLVNTTISSRMASCRESFSVSPRNGALLLIDDAGNRLLADEMDFPPSILFERVDAIPVASRQPAPLPDDGYDEEAARQAQEAAERAAFDTAEAEARERIRIDLPTSRALWAEAGVDTYTLRFEVGALKVDDSFPQRRPVGGVWEIDVVDGVAEENEWSNSILGDTVEDWFAYVESQLDSHYLRVEFDSDLGFPSTIDSQPLDDRVVDDPNSIVAWLVFGEVVVPT